MKIIKKIISICIILVLTQTNISIGANLIPRVEAGDPDAIAIYDVIEGLSGYVEEKYPDYYDGEHDPDKIRDVANKLNELCKEAGIDPSLLQADYDDIGWRGAQDKESIIYKTVDTAKKTDSTGNTGNANTEQNKSEREAMEKQIADAMSGYKQKDTEELKKIDEMIKEYRKKFPEGWGVTNDIYTYSKNLNEELNSREDAKDHQTSLEEEQQEREEVVDNQQQLEDGPSTGVLGNSNASADHTMDEIIGEGEDFLNKGGSTTTIDGNNLEEASSTIYNILLSIGIFLAVAIGLYLGVKFMLSTAEDKAKVKEALIPYIAGCVVIFTAFAVWKIVIELLGGLA